MPRAEFKITGDIAQFDRIDDLYKVMRREGIKLLTNWEITVKAEYAEQQGTPVVSNG